MIPVIRMKNICMVCFLQWGANSIKKVWKIPEVSSIKSFVEEKKVIQLRWNWAILETFRNKIFLFVMIDKWNFVRFHKIENDKDSFYLDIQKSFVPNATKLCNFCDMMFDVSNYLYVVEPITLGVWRKKEVSV